jgi:hypothetical protein
VEADTIRLGGIIEGTYRGELIVLLTVASGHPPKKFRKGERVAQLIILPLVESRMVDVGNGELPPSERGTDGFGSTDTDRNPGTSSEGARVYVGKGPNFLSAFNSLEAKVKEAMMFPLVPGPYDDEFWAEKLHKETESMNSSPWKPSTEQIRQMKQLVPITSAFTDEHVTDFMTSPTRNYGLALGSSQDFDVWKERYCQVNGIPLPSGDNPPARFQPGDMEFQDKVAKAQAAKEEAERQNPDCEVTISDDLQHLFITLPNDQDDDNDDDNDDDDDNDWDDNDDDDDDDDNDWDDNDWDDLEDDEEEVTRLQHAIHGFVAPDSLVDDAARGLWGKIQAHYQGQPMPMPVASIGAKVRLSNGHTLEVRGHEYRTDSKGFMVSVPVSDEVNQKVASRLLDLMGCVEDPRNFQDSPEASQNAPGEAKGTSQVESPQEASVSPTGPSRASSVEYGHDYETSRFAMPGVQHSGWLKIAMELAKKNFLAGGTFSIEDQFMKLQDTYGKVHSELKQAEELVADLKADNATMKAQLRELGQETTEALNERDQQIAKLETLVTHWQADYGKLDRACMQISRQKEVLRDEATRKGDERRAALEKENDRLKKTDFGVTQDVLSRLLDVVRCIRPRYIGEDAWNVIHEAYQVAGKPNPFYLGIDVSPGEYKHPKAGKPGDVRPAIQPDPIEEHNRAVFDVPKYQEQDEPKLRDSLWGPSKVVPDHRKPFSMPDNDRDYRPSGR